MHSCLSQLIYRLGTISYHLTAIRSLEGWFVALIKLLVLGGPFGSSQILCCSRDVKRAMLCHVGTAAQSCLAGGPAKHGPLAWHGTARVVLKLCSAFMPTVSWASCSSSLLSGKKKKKQWSYTLLGRKKWRPYIKKIKRYTKWLYQIRPIPTLLRREPFEYFKFEDFSIGLFSKLLQLFFILKT